VTSYRFPLDWRLLLQDDALVNESVVNFYINTVNSLLSNNIQPHIVVFDTTYLQVNGDNHKY